MQNTAPGPKNMLFLSVGAAIGRPRGSMIVPTKGYRI